MAQMPEIMPSLLPSSYHLRTSSYGLFVKIALVAVVVITTATTTTTVSVYVCFELGLFQFTKCVCLYIIFVLHHLLATLVNVVRVVLEKYIDLYLYHSVKKTTFRAFYLSVSNFSSLFQVRPLKILLVDRFRHYECIKILTCGLARLTNAATKRMATIYLY